MANKQPDFIPVDEVEEDDSQPDFIPEDQAEAPSPTPVAAAPKQPLIEQIGHNLGQAGIGAAKGLGQTMNSIGHVLIPDALVRGLGGNVPTPESEESTFGAKNTAQSVGKGIEQGAEFLLPGLGEEAAVAKLGKFAKPAKIAYNALTSGGLNKLQGGDFKTGAAVGGLGSAVGMGLQSLAPHLAESALDISKADRAYGRTPGEAIIQETKGVRPSSVGASAQQRASELGQTVEKAANSSTTPASLTPARDVITNRLVTGVRRGEKGLVDQLQPIGDSLQRNPITGQAYGQTVQPSQLLDIKRGFSNEHIGNWRPETMSDVTNTAKQAYRGLADEFHRVVPGAADADKRIASLIPVVKKAEAADRAASTTQRVLGRVGRATGALAGAGSGAYLGGKEGGTPGAIVGGLTGLVAPEVIASPTGQMIMARGLNALAPGAVRGAAGLGLQADRKKKEDKK